LLERCAWKAFWENISVYIPSEQPSDNSI